MVKGKSIIFTEEEESKIIKMYCEDRLPLHSISKEMKVCDQTTKNVLEKNGIQFEKRLWRNEKTRKLMSEIKMEQFKEGKWKPWNKGKKVPWLREWNIKNSLYNKVNLETKKEIVRMYDVEKMKILNIKKKTLLNIPLIRRILLESKVVIKDRNPKWNYGLIGFLSGEKSPTWKGGLSFEPYSHNFNKHLKRMIRIRDNYTCQECNITEKELKIKEKFKYNHSLRIHHIDYDKMNNSQFNLISLCNRCHSKTNGNRNHWTNYFKMKVFIKELFNPQNILIFENNKLKNMSCINYDKTN